MESQKISDLTKTIGELSERGFTEFDILGAEGGDTGHMLGVWGSLAEISVDLTIRLYHENSTTHRITSASGNFEINMEKDRIFSVFALSKCKMYVLKVLNGKLKMRNLIYRLKDFITKV